jgi:TonB family protein
MRFPNDRIGPAPAVPSPATTVSRVAPPAIPPSGMAPPAPPAIVAPVPSPVETVSPAAPPALSPIVELPAPSAVLAPTTPEPVVLKPVELQIVKDEPPALTSPEVSASILEPSTSPEKKWEREPESSEAIKLHTARLQEQLSSMLFPGAEGGKSEPTPLDAAPVESESASEIASKIIEISQTETAPSLETSTVRDASTAPSAAPDEEDIKIPAWLEPLARNTIAPVSTQDLIERAKAKLSVEKLEISEPAPEVVAPVEAAYVPELRIPSFGSKLPMDEISSSPERTPSRSNNGMRIGATAAGIILLAAGGFWYLKQQGGSQNSTVAAPSPVAAEVLSTPAQQLPAKPATAQASTVMSAVEFPAPAAASQPAPVLENSKSTDAGTSAASRVVQPASTPVQSRSLAQLKTEPKPQPVKPSLGKVHLAAPKVNRQVGSKDSVNNDPGLTLSNEQAVPNIDSMGGDLVSGSVKEPAAPVAPLPVGGDVKPAKLLASVPPVYPSLARNQHVSGDVKVDALIDADGRVTTMKVLSGPTLLHQAAMDALHQWKYQPATLDGKFVPMHLTITIQFRLQ